MGSREKILQALKANKPPLTALPTTPSFYKIPQHNLQENFINTLTGIGGICTVVANIDEVENVLTEKKNQNLVIVNGIEALGEVNTNVYDSLHPTELEKISSVFIKGTLGVAENGAIWLTETNMINRMLPFICEHLILVIDAKTIVPSMHDAYEKINISEEGYGVFIAGPSKTADIEQSLVIGAHGPLSLQVYIISE